MKRFVAIICMMVMVAMMTSCYAETEEKFFYERNIWFDSIKNEMENAIENGEQIRSDTYLYDGIVYYAGTGMYMGGLDYEGEKDSPKEIEEFLENILIKEGAKHPQVEIRRAGKADDGEWLYRCSIMMMENINEYEGEYSGSGYIADGIEYYGIVGVGKIHY